MNKKGKLIITVLVVIISCFCLYKIADATSYTLVKTKAEIYLCHKYDAKFSEIELTDYRRAGVYWDDYNIFWLTPQWVDFSFEFKYNDRYVMVNRFNGKFYDDYQLDDIENWSTQWLQKNIDERITGIRLDSTHIFWYLHNTNKSHNYIITQDDTEEFLNSFSFNGDDENSNRFYYYDERVKKIRDYDVEPEINKQITSKLNSNLNLYGYTFCTYSLSSIEKVDVKSPDDVWTNMFH